MQTTKIMLFEYSIEYPNLHTKGPVHAPNMDTPGGQALDRGPGKRHSSLVLCFQGKPRLVDEEQRTEPCYVSTLWRTQIESSDVPKTLEESVFDKIRKRDFVCHPKIDTRTYFEDFYVPAVFAPATPY